MSASAARRGISAGEFTSESLVQDCLARIDARDGVVRAWTHIDRDAALDQARARDRAPATGPLHGVPIAVKDVIDVEGLPTGCGSPIHAETYPVIDAGCVAMARRAGAVILGKTVTTEFAAITPGPTMHPLDPKRSPGGSSSGSAACVADFMAPLALATQTIGSTIRPAAYCGVVGFKPSYGTFALGGVKGQAPSMDTLGLMARGVEDVVLFAEALWGEAGSFTAPPPNSVPRIAVCRTGQWPEARPETIAAIDDAARRFAGTGATVREVSLPPIFDEVLGAQWTILKFEFSRVLAPELAHQADRISAPLRSLLQDGMRLSSRDYRAALRLAEDCRVEAAARLGEWEAVLTPAAAGVALPLGMPSDLLFQRLWTVLHLPAITVPGYRGPGELPVGIQLVARSGSDAELLSLARWAETLLSG